MECFLGLFDKTKYTNFADFDFSLIKERLDRIKVVKAEKTGEEKKNEALRKEVDAKPYRYCMYDGRMEKVSNYMVEPPGIFRGRGEHPAAGKLKSRIVPEFVQINIGQNNPIPICHVPGHSWKRVVEKKDATWLAVFRDERSTFGAGTKYVALAAESTVKGDNDRKKYEKARRLKKSIQTIRSNYMTKMKSTDMQDNQLGVCTYLIDQLALRVGNEKGEDEADTVGCCSLRVEHITCEEDNKVTLDFLGKDSMRYYNTIDVLPIVHQLLRKFTLAKKPEDDIFDAVTPGKLNDYLKESMEDLSAKVFRTYNASYCLQDELTKGSDKIDAEKTPLDEKIKFYNDCNRKVAILCNH